MSNLQHDNLVTVAASLSGMVVGFFLFHFGLVEGVVKARLKPLPGVGPSLDHEIRRASRTLGAFLALLGVALLTVGFIALRMRFGMMTRTEQSALLVVIVAGGSIAGGLYLLRVGLIEGVIQGRMRQVVDLWYLDYGRTATESRLYGSYLTLIGGAMFTAGVLMIRWLYWQLIG